MRARDIQMKHVLEGLVACQIVHKVMDNYGEYDPNTSTIYIANGGKLRVRIDTLIHEAIHAYHEKRGMNEDEELTRKQTKIIMRRIYG